MKIKPLSINEAWRGQRYKTPAYKAYEYELMLRLPQLKIPEPPFKIFFEFGFSNKASDLDNPIKCLTDILQKKYEFNDKEIHEMNITKKIVAKGEEYFVVRMENYLASS